MARYQECRARATRRAAALRSWKHFPPGPAHRPRTPFNVPAAAGSSEEERNAKTHRGTWSLFAETFVATGRFDAALYRRARAAEERRIDVHYEAGRLSDDEARVIVPDAQELVAAVERMLE